MSFRDVWCGGGDRVSRGWDVLLTSQKSISCMDSAVLTPFTSRSAVFLQSRPGLVEMKLASLLIIGQPRFGFSLFSYCQEHLVCWLG